eukprot:40794_1
MSACIKGPFSTTTDYGVAVNFCAPQGMIVQMDIDLQQWKLEKHNEMKMKSQVHYYNFMDMSWISDFSNEKEIFCIGGGSKFEFISIIDAPSGKNYAKYVAGIRQMTGYLSENHRSVQGFIQNNNVDIHSEMQIIYRLLSHELYQYYPSHTHAKEFKSCPPYIAKLMHAQCSSMSSIIFSKLDTLGLWNKMEFLFFKQENGWINLQIVTRMFPNVMSISCYNIDIVLLKQSIIYQSVLSCSKNKPLCIMLEINTDGSQQMKENSQQMKECINKYERDFTKNSWFIRIHSEYRPKPDAKQMVYKCMGLKQKHWHLIDNAFKKFNITPDKMLQDIKKKMLLDDIWNADKYILWLVMYNQKYVDKCGRNGTLYFEQI